MSDSTRVIQHGGSVLHSGTHVPHKMPSLHAMQCVTQTGIRQAVFQECEMHFQNLTCVLINLSHKCIGVLKKSASLLYKNMSYSQMTAAFAGQNAYKRTRVGQSSVEKEPKMS